MPNTAFRATPTTENTPTTATPAPELPAPANSAVLAQVGDAGNAMEGPMGRLFSRIGGQGAGADMSLSRDHLHDYLDKGLQFADGEWFRGTKLNGATDSLLGQLDSDKSKGVDWTEFGAFRDQVLGALAPGLEEGATAEDVQAAAAGQFAALNSDRNGSTLSMDEIQAGALAMLPEDTEHRDLVAQLGARVAIDAVDTDQRDLPVADRALSEAEWVQAAMEIQQARSKR